MKPIQVAVLILLGAIWGASFLFIRVAAHSFGPLALMFSRVFLAGIVLLGYAVFINRTTEKPKYTIVSRWKQFLIVGAINSAIPFTLIAWSELTLHASLAAIINSTTPLFTAMIAALWGSENLTWQKLVGVVLGVVGVTVLVGGSSLDINQTVILSVLASLGAAASYGLGTVYASRNLGGMKPIQNSIGQLLGASTVLLIPAGLNIPAEMPSNNAIIAFLALALISTSFAYLLYFYLLTNVGPTRTASVTFLVPVFGSVWGVIFLGEQFSIGMILGGAIILASVWLVIGARYQERKPVPKAVEAA